MNLPLLSALALTGLWPVAVHGYSDATPAQEKTEKTDPAAAPDDAKTVWEYLSGRYDANKDGKISQDEYTRGASQFARLDKDKNGFIEASDSEQASGRGGRRGGGGRGRRGAEGGGRPAPAPTEGSPAPDFELETLYPAAPAKGDKKDPARESAKESEEAAQQKADPKFESVKLSSFKGKKPVALIFGSYT